MARSQSTESKKENEKRKIQKRKDKEQRKEERKANSLKGKSFEDMLAYVDENGNITATPPDPTKKRSISADDIVISAPKQEGLRNALRTGKINYYNPSKGYGFITDDQTRESIFVHGSALATAVKENDRVSFQTERGPKGFSAINVKKI